MWSTCISCKTYYATICIRARDENAILVCPTEDTSDQCTLILCNDIGAPLDSKYIDFEPLHLAITQYHVAAASASFVYVWQFRTLMSKLTSVDAGTNTLRRREGRERCCHVERFFIGLTTYANATHSFFATLSHFAEGASTSMTPGS